MDLICARESIAISPRQVCSRVPQSSDQRFRSLLVASPTEDNAGAQQQVILTIVGAVGEGGRIVICLEETKRKPGLKWHVDASTNAALKGECSVARARDSASCMSRAGKNLGKRNNSMRAPGPRLRKAVSCSG
jgi:hypothetical protein